MLGVSLSRGSSAVSHSLISLNGHYASSRRSSVWTGAPARPLTSSRCPPARAIQPDVCPRRWTEEPCCPLEDETGQRTARRKDRRAANESIRADNLKRDWGGCPLDACRLFPGNSIKRLGHRREDQQVATPKDNR